MSRKVLVDFLIPILIVLILTLFFRLTDVDMALERLLFSKEQGWFLEHIWVFSFLNYYDMVPAFVILFVALCILVIGFLTEKLSKYRKIALFFVFFFILGSILIVNLVLKQHWGRPRPNQVKSFGGDQQFMPVWAKGIGGRNRSFPSGDASTGFFLFAPFFVLRRRSPRTADLCLLTGTGYGLLVGLGRMSRGAHFASDVFMAGGIMYLVGLSLYYIFGMQKDTWL